ncbi:MAG: HD domain-containing protein [Bacteroidota bacterium]|nr:HD domain-containing protein [Bacteroidota bacterium]
MNEQISIDSEIKWLNHYVEEFFRPDDDFYNQNIQLKHKHSLLVCKHIINLAEDMNLSQYQTTLAGIIGLYHDVGRFRQYRDYNTFSDKDSVYHGDLGIEVLKDIDKLENFTPGEQQIIIASIHNHGLPKIEENLDEQTMIFAKMIRDADKMDIFRIVDDYYHDMLKGKRNVSLELGLKNEDNISKKVLDAFYSESIVYKSDMHYLNDFKILQIAWIYDLNFTYTRHYILHSGHLESIIKSISVQDIQKDIKTKALDYLTRESHS